MQVLPTKAGTELSLVGHTLVLPGAGGTAHLGELAVDALISTFGLRRVAVVQTPLILPVAMPSAWQGSQQSENLELTTAAELYQSETVPSLTVLQIRSPPVDGRRRALAKELWDWACNARFSQLLVVSPCAAYMRQDADLNSKTSIRFAHTGTCTDPAALVAEAGFGEQVLPLSNSLPPVSTDDEEEASNENRHLAAVQQFLRGGGLTRPLLYEAAEATISHEGDAKAKGDLPAIFSLLAYTTAILDFQVLEQLARAACVLTSSRLGLQVPEMKFPTSWALEAAMSK
mmetsp:Transcript_64167/g.101788  ORF Transcript_64167/g.101788 Transcript_64167/m.101788 type:complete len:287 (+) Transcript_64167:34-894(+)